MIAYIQHVGRIRFGFGAVAELASELQSLRMSRPLLMLDDGVAKAGLDKRVLDNLTQGNQTAIFSECPSHPTEDAVLNALHVYRERECDGLIALGGGAVIDLAKGVALMATPPGMLADYAVGSAASSKITEHVAPLVCIPTTAGTGSEVGRGAGISIGSGGEKAIFMSVNLVPKVALYDPDFTITLPAGLTAATGADALGHAVEGYLSPAINPLVDAIALDGIQRLYANLGMAVSKPTDRDARWNVMMGALQGGMCMWKGLGWAHALSIPLDTFNLHHGTLIGLLLPETVGFARHIVPEKLTRLDQVFGGRAEERLLKLKSDIGLPHDLSALRVPFDALRNVADAATKSVFNQTAPRPAQADEYFAMLEKVY